MLLKRKYCFVFVILLTAALPSCSQNNTNKPQADSVKNDPIPELLSRPSGYVSDFDRLFTDEQVTELSELIAAHEKKTTNQIAVVTWEIDTLRKESPDFEKFSLALFRKWGVGQKDKNNGIGILICPNIRKIKIDVGYGLEEKLTNDEAKHIIETIIVPSFKKADYYTGTKDALIAIIKEIE